MMVPCEVDYVSAGARSCWWMMVNEGKYGLLLSSRVSLGENKYHQIESALGAMGVSCLVLVHCLPHDRIDGHNNHDCDETDEGQRERVESSRVRPLRKGAYFSDNRDEHGAQNAAQ
jgi:hypothetical protein